MSHSADIDVERRPDRSDSWNDLKTRTGVNGCLQCHKCTAGCPVADRGDLQTSQIVRLTQLGDEAALYRSTAIWRCTGCHTCTSRCPAGVDPARLQDLLKRRSLERGVVPSDRRTFEAQDALLDTVSRFGRLAEIRMVRRFKQRSHTLFERASLGMALFLRGKLKLTRQRMRDRTAIRNLIEQDRIVPDDR